MTLVEELRATFLTGGLTDEQLAELIEAGTTVEFEPDDELFREGEPADYLWILLEGSIGLYRQAISETSHLMTMTTPGQWAGGLRAWGDASAASGYRASGAGMSSGRVFRVPSEDLGRLAAQQYDRFPRTLRFLLSGIGATGRRGWDLVSYLAFEPVYIRRLLDLGYRDTMRREKEVRAFFG